MDATNPISPLHSTPAAGSRGVPRLEQPKPADETAARLRKLEDATSDFEALFLAQLLKPLAKSISSTSQGSQLGGTVMVEVAMEKMAEALADKGGIGLGDMLFTNLKDRISEDSVGTDPQEDKALPLHSDGDEPVDFPLRDQPIPIPLKTDH